MTRATTPHFRPSSSPIKGAMLAFGRLLTDRFPPSPTAAIPARSEAMPRATRTGLGRRFLAWWNRPIPTSTSGAPRNATEAVTRLEILARGGFSR